MHQIKNILFLFGLFLLFSCIKAYDPEIDGAAENKYVVSGRIVNTEGWQEVDVSLSSPVSSPKYIPVEGCEVKIYDNTGNIFPTIERQPGRYMAYMQAPDLNPGTAYQVRVTTPGGEELVSGYDTMPRGPQLDSVTYSIEDVPTANPGESLKVMQFYIDLNAVGNYSRYYKWDILETWEYHAALPAQYYYNGATHEIIPPDYTNNVCYATGLVKNVFTLSTKSLSQNSYHQFPLHTIDGTTSRLAYMYSMLVTQLALSEAAFNYWEQMRINSNEQGGLYEKQPLAIKGNIVNLTNPGKDVLGFFYASSVSSSRYFYHDVPGIPMDYYNFCSPYPLGKFGWREVYPWEYPVYFYYNEVGALRVLNIECVDCRALGGTTTKPDFWPK
ncbi:MAG: DUF4249 domain-containing protein [Bacteroidales bacterium]